MNYLINQEEAIEKLSKLKVGALFMEMGTGKTKVACDLINSRTEMFVLWICPYSVKDQTEEEVKKWTNRKVNVIGIESLVSDKLYLNLLTKMTSGFLVVDESLKIKNRSTIRFRRCMQLGKLARYRLVLNGTPVSKNVLDLWTQMEFLSPKILNMSYNQFKNTYAEYYVRGKLQGLVKKQHNIPHLMSLIEPYIFESRLDIEANKKYINHYYSVNREAYDRLKEEMLQYFSDDDSADFYAFTTKLQQFYTKSQLKQNLIDQIKGQAIVYVKYLDNIPKKAIAITGETKNRDAIIERFRQKEFEKLYMTYGTGALGLNLQFCNQIIFADQTFDYAMKLQAEARIYRIGQDEDVTYHSLLADTGLEKLIQKSLSKKTDLLSEIKNEISQKGTQEWLKSI